MPPTARAPTTRAQLVLVALMCAVSFGVLSLIGLAVPLLPRMVEDLHPTFASHELIVSALMSAFPAAMLVCSPLVNALAARVGRYHLLRAGLILAALATLCFAFAPRLARGHAAPTIALLFASRVAQGAGACAANQAMFAIIVAAFDENLGAVMGLNEVAIGASSSLSPVIGTALFAAAGGGARAIVLPLACAAALLAATVPFAVYAEATSARDKAAIAAAEPLLARMRLAVSASAVGGGSVDDGGGCEAFEPPSLVPRSLSSPQPKVPRSASGTAPPKLPRSVSAACAPLAPPIPRSRSSTATLPFFPSDDGGAIATLTPRLLFAATGVCLAMALFGVANGIIVLHLHAIGLSDGGCGLTYGIFSASYSLAAPAAGVASDRWAGIFPPPRCAHEQSNVQRYQDVMSLGLIVSGVAALGLAAASALVPPSAGVRARWACELAALALMGAGQAAALIPSLAAVKAGAPDVTDERVERQTDNIVTLYNVAMQAGLAAGPLLGAALESAGGFPSAMGATGVACVAYGACGVCMRVVSRLSPESTVADAGSAAVGAAGDSPRAMLFRLQRRASVFGVGALEYAGNGLEVGGGRSRWRRVRSRMAVVSRMRTISRESSSARLARGRASGASAYGRRIAEL
ncbi:hypothetical protein KFE25_012388 [Diacronema lutheri]|uniref:Major facilitator superfamily (MFS) profile domain-containing protein n=1 Tax=Diacronema lutheri TaxID=2081491 RepID=A0A8J5XT98_DIALT|nr:hypothetical protein KFE25_012388 [Diacronema lutheri]